MSGSAPSVTVVLRDRTGCEKQKTDNIVLLMEDEQTLIQKAKEGKEEAFGVLYDRHISAIYRFVFLKVGGKKGDAEDITHEVFLSAWKNIGNYKFQGFPFSSWLYRIARNAIIDYYRTSKQNQNIAFHETPEHLLISEKTEEHDLDKTFEMERIKKCLALLEPTYQDVLIMKFVEDRSNKEIAAALEKSEGAIRVIQHRALKQLKKYLEETNEQSHQTTQSA